MGERQLPRPIHQEVQTNGADNDDQHQAELVDGRLSQEHGQENERQRGHEDSERLGPHQYADRTRPAGRTSSKTMTKPASATSTMPFTGETYPITPSATPSAIPAA